MRSGTEPPHPHSEAGTALVERYAPETVATVNVEAPVLPA